MGASTQSMDCLSIALGHDHTGNTLTPVIVFLYAGPFIFCKNPTGPLEMSLFWNIVAFFIKLLFVFLHNPLSVLFLFFIYILYWPQIIGAYVWRFSILYVKTFSLILD